MEDSDRADKAVLLVAWVLPLLVVAALLAVAGLPRVAVALVAVEVVVGLLVVAARRRPVRPVGAPAARPWLVPLVMVLVVVALGALAGLATLLG